eukprot:TRINITY_DN11391_c0_g1_i2.p1 TRINITY_DN11391_c0_g1~~TRINITY_DN11391_c0_g1_i2.p1  ORF type:complete len:925 (+),score=176.90 TRINITY_DN11391_c0_g1_i2:165-2939(+)
MPLLLYWCALGALALTRARLSRLQVDAAAAKHAVRLWRLRRRLDANPAGGDCCSACCTAAQRRCCSAGGECGLRLRRPQSCSEARKSARWGVSSLLFWGGSVYECVGLIALSFHRLVPWPAVSPSTPRLAEAAEHVNFLFDGAALVALFWVVAVAQIAFAALFLWFSRRDALALFTAPCDCCRHLVERRRASATVAAASNAEAAPEMKDVKEGGKDEGAAENEMASATRGLQLQALSTLVEVVEHAVVEVAKEKKRRRTCGAFTRDWLWPRTRHYVKRLVLGPGAEFFLLMLYFPSMMICFEMLGCGDKATLRRAPEVRCWRGFHVVMVLVSLLTVIVLFPAALLAAKSEKRDTYVYLPTWTIANVIIQLVLSITSQVFTFRSTVWAYLAFVALCLFVLATGTIVLQPCITSGAANHLMAAGYSEALLACLCAMIIIGAGWTRRNWEIFLIFGLLSPPVVCFAALLSYLRARALFRRQLRTIRDSRPGQNLKADSDVAFLILKLSLSCKTHVALVGQCLEQIVVLLRSANVMVRRLLLSSLINLSSCGNTHLELGEDDLLQGILFCLRQAKKDSTARSRALQVCTCAAQSGGDIVRTALMRYGCLPVLASCLRMPPKKAATGTSAAHEKPKAGVAGVVVRRALDALQQLSLADENRRAMVQCDHLIARLCLLLQCKRWPKARGKALALAQSLGSSAECRHYLLLAGVPADVFRAPVTASPPVDTDGVEALPSPVVCARHLPAATRSVESTASVHWRGENRTVLKTALPNAEESTTASESTKGATPACPTLTRESKSTGTKRSVRRAASLVAPHENVATTATRPSKLPGTNALPAEKTTTDTHPHNPPSPAPVDVATAPSPAAQKKTLEPQTTTATSTRRAVPPQATTVRQAMARAEPSLPQASHKPRKHLPPLKHPPKQRKPPQ